MIKALPAFTILLFAAPAFAGDGPLAFGGFAEKAATGQYAMPKGDFRETEAPLVGAIRIGALDVRLEETPMADVAKVLGGTINEAGEAGGYVLWLCLALPEHVLWISSDGEMGEGKAGRVALEAGPAAPEWGCAPSSLDIAQIDFGAARLGAPLADVAADFGELAPDSEGRLGYVVQSPHPDAEGFSIYQDFAFRVKDGAIDAIAVGQQTAD